MRGGSTEQLLGHPLTRPPAWSSLEPPSEFPLSQLLPPPLLPNGFAAPDILNKVVARVWLQGSLICLGWGNDWLKADRVLLLGKGFWHSTNVETC